MLDTIDIKIFGVVGILILLVIGYFVYLLYQDLVFLKKEVTELKQENWSSEEEEQDDFSEQTEEEEDDQEQDEELERHLASFMASQQENEFHQHLEPIQEIQEPEQEVQLTQEEQVPEPEVKVVKKTIQEKVQLESESEPTTEIEV